MIIEWTDAYEIGIPSLDDDHRKLVNVTNRFFEQAQDGADRIVLTDTLDQIVTLLGAHFKHEEEELDRHDYPDRLSHLTEHRQQMLQLQRFVDSVKSGTLPQDQTITQADQISHLLVRHIIEDDFPFKSSLRTLT
jgi:hemerythrin-like metal-binding protein